MMVRLLAASIILKRPRAKRYGTKKPPEGIATTQGHPLDCVDPLPDQTKRILKEDKFMFLSPFIAKAGNIAHLKSGMVGGSPRRRYNYPPRIVTEKVRQSVLLQKKVREALVTASLVAGTRSSSSEGSPDVQDQSKDRPTADL
jgi:hypothetical protein